MKITGSDLAELLPKYRRWIAEGKPKNALGYVPKGEASQNYYDPYHDNIRENDDGTFSFDIQVYDSPEGDTWMVGKFKITENGDIIVTEQRGVGR